MIRCGCKIFAEEEGGYGRIYKKKVENFVDLLLDGPN